MLFWFVYNSKYSVYDRYVLFVYNTVKKGIVDKSNWPIIVNVLTIRTYSRQVKQTYHTHCVNYYNSIVNK
jgi:hypothetical protein